MNHEFGNARTSWTLARNGQRLTCTLIANGGSYTVRITHAGHHIVEERCDGPEAALVRSFEAFTALATRGWITESAVN
jgi:hypothetical protein